VAYRADIEIAVKGAQELKRLQDQVSATSKLVDGLNNYLSNIGGGGVVRSINNLNAAVADTAAAFNKAALGTEEATLAARNFVSANSNLTRGLEERLALLKSIGEQERRQRLGAAGIRETTQYAEPIGPGQASPVALRSDLRGRTQQLLNERTATLELADALGQLEERRRQETNALLDAKAASVAQTFLAGKTQYGGPIGPGPASPVGSLVGQKSPVAERISQTLQAKRDEIQLQAALLRLEEKSAARLNDKLELQYRLNRAALAQGKTDVETVSAQQAQRQQFLAGKSGTAIQGPLAGPGAMGFPVALSLSKVEQAGLETAAKKQEILQRMAATRQALVGLAANLQRLDQNSTVAIADAVRNQLKLNAAKLQELNTTQQIRATEAAASKAARQRLSDAAALRSPAASKKGGFLSELSNPSSKIGSAVIGGGFPALMGGGPGTIAGGAVGGILGGFAGSIGGSAIGQFLDQAVQKVQELGNAINTLNFDNVTKSGVRLTGELRTQLDLLLKVGQAQQAQELVSQEVAAATGTPAGTTEDIANAVNLLNVAFNSVVGTVSTLLGIIGAPFVAALAAILGVVNLIVKGLNVVLGFVGSLIKDVGEWVVALVGGEDAVRNIERGLAGVNGQFDEAIAKANQLRVDLNQAVVTASQNLGFERRMTPGSTAGEKLTNNDVELEQKLAGITNDRLDANIKIREENAQAELAVPGTIAGLVKQNNLTFDLLETTEKLRASRKAQSIQIQEDARIAQENARIAREAAQAAEKAQRQAEARANSLLQIEKELYNVDLQTLAVNVQQTGVLAGTYAALQRQYDVAESKRNISIAILQLEHQSALVEAAKLGTTAQVNILYAAKLALLEKQLITEKAITDQAQRQIALDQFVATQTEVDTAVKPVKDFLADQEQEVQLAKIYSRLLMEGVLPAEAQRQVNFEKIISSQLRSLDIQIATTKETIAQATALNITGEAMVKLTERLQNLEKARAGVTAIAATGPGAGPTDRDRLQTEADRVRGELNTLTDPINAITTAAAGIGDAFAMSFKGIIDGSMTAKEALGSFFKSVADMFLEMAAQIIAKQITMIILQTILKALGGAPGGGGGANLTNTQATDFGFNPSAMTGSLTPGGLFAKGGAFTNSVVSSPTMFKFADGGTTRTGLMGEAGPEAIMPLKRGADGSLGVQANGLREAMDRQQGGGGGSPVLNMSFQSTSINGVEYVSRDQLESAMAETRRSASRDGAKRGMTMTLDRIQNSSSTRRKVGI
jgi:lambda family phage tail tape measure protein